MPSTKSWSTKPARWNCPAQRNGGAMLFSGNSVNSIRPMTSKSRMFISRRVNCVVFFSVVNKEELSRFVRSLKVLEHCIQPFLDHCDTDNDSKITSDEWGTCLGLDQSKDHRMSLLFEHIALFFSRWHGFLKDILLALNIDVFGLQQEQ